jgi:SAM-dependent methyltransferase
MEANHQLTCDFCHSSQLQDCYSVPDSAIGMVIQTCINCGLVQSKQTKPNPVERIVSTSSGATWGNIRHGKGLRLEKAIPIINSMQNWDMVRSILDVGANRGDFIKWILSQKPQTVITAVEPDLRIVEPYENLPSVNFIGKRFENTELPENSFDLVYLSHTLEHADSASEMLIKILKLLRSGGTLFLEVPNLDIINSQDIFEEFFIDKHRFHFERGNLCAYLRSIGYKIEYGDGDEDQFNITILANKADNMLVSSFNYAPKNQSNFEEQLLNYKTNLEQNREKLKLASQKIQALISRQKVAFWGAGRQFDALIRFGGIDTSKIKFLVDEHLWKYLKEVHGVTIHRPEELKIYQPQIVVILARGSEDEIARKARRLDIKNVIKLRDLLI